MAYQTLYRKWRPRTFDEVIGQNHITSTLKNEITSGKTAHAYIFTGTRGTGKTSTAKILSRALNCENSKDGNPCNECSACKGIINETILDVVEMDAASNNGVENIREIIDQVRYSTASTKYKVYIIDEVHMLSMGAFNALLKTLEEPPSHVVFILATTEIHKVPATILSRCQRFDFKNISSSEIADAVQNILDAEGIRIEKDAVEYISYLGAGSMRDALSITEQCLAYKPNDITYRDITDILGTLDDEFLYTSAQYIALGDTKSLLIHFNECIKNGKNPESFAEGMLKALRDILLYKISPEMCDFTTRKKKLIDEASKPFTHEKLVRCIDILSAALRDIKMTSDTSVVVECTFIRMASPSYENNLDSLLDRISALESKIAMAKTVSYSVPEVKETTKPETPVTPKKEPAKEEIKPVLAGASSDIVSSWEIVKRELESRGKLITFVSLYGVNPCADGDDIKLIFDSKDSLKRFSSGSAVIDLKEVLKDKFGFMGEIKCVFEDKNDQNIGAENDIFDDIERISRNFPENFKID
jgi:DNA polymerase-3 subunit gamma/tau